MSPIEKAIAICGSQYKLADAIGVNQSFVSQMAKDSKPVPARLCRKIHAATDGQVSLASLRPDLYDFSQAVV